MPPTDKDDNVKKPDLKTFSFAPPEGSLNTPLNSKRDAANDREMPIEALNENVVGKVVAGHFQILSKIGEGGMSVVYKARHMLMNKQVALKMLHPHMIGREQSRDRFRQEAQAVSQIDHPNVVRIFDFGISEDNRPYIVMDYLDGVSLGDMIKASGPLELERAIKLFIQICDALSYAHNKGVIHRDLKPSNIIILESERKKSQTISYVRGTQDENEDLSERQKEQAKIVDFGIAKLMPHEGTDAAALTQTGDVFGSPLYMSPEQCKGEKLDGRSDIYSMGCLMYETLTGKPPINGANMLEILYRHMNEMPISMKLACPENKVPQALEAIIFKALAKDPNDRQASMRLLKSEIEDFSSNQGGALSFISSGWNLYRLKRKRLTLREKIAATISLFALGLAILCSSSLIFLYAYGQDQGKENQPLDWYIQFADKKETPTVFDTSALGTDNLLDKARARVRQIHHKQKGSPISARDELDDPNSDLQQILNAADSAYRTSRFRDAAEIYQYCEEISSYENGPDAITTQEIALSLFRSYYYAGDYSQAIRQAAPTLKAFQNEIDANSSKRMKAALLSAIGDCYYRTGDYDKARSSLYDAVELWRELGPSGKTNRDKTVEELRALSLSRFGDVFMQLKMNEAAVKYYDLGEEAWKGSTDERQRLYNLGLISYKKSLAEFARHDYSKANSDFERAVKELKKKPSDKLFHQSVVTMYQQTAIWQKQSDRLLASIGSSLQAGISKYFQEYK
jgi:serine/threonine protein kinase